MHAAPAGRPAPGLWHVAFALWNGAFWAVWLVVPFVLAGPRWWPGWLHLCALSVGLLVHGRWVRRRQPALVARRRQIGAGTRGWDLLWNALYWPALVSIAVVAAWQTRRTGAALSWAFVPAGVALLEGALALSAWAMGSNPFFEGTARLQREVGQRVVEAGPYRFVRHPGYVSLAGWALATPLILRSTWAFAPAAAVAVWVGVRTALEDRMLRRGLDGYADYARRVRRRLLPGVW